MWRSTNSSIWNSEQTSWNWISRFYHVLYWQFVTLTTLQGMHIFNFFCCTCKRPHLLVYLHFAGWSTDIISLTHLPSIQVKSNCIYTAPIQNKCYLMTLDTCRAGLRSQARHAFLFYQNWLTLRRHRTEKSSRWMSRRTSQTASGKQASTTRRHPTLPFVIAHRYSPEWGGLTLRLQPVLNAVSLKHLFSEEEVSEQQLFHLCPLRSARGEIPAGVEAERDRRSAHP